MAEVSQADVLNALRRVQDPDLRRDVVALNMIKDLTVQDGRVSFRLVLTTPACPMKDQMERDARNAVAGLPGVTEVSVRMDHEVPAGARMAGKQSIPGVKNVIASSSGKGGVGKSTVAVNTALALAEFGASVGLVDCDVFGPNIPMMMGVHGLPPSSGDKIKPAMAYGVEVMSIGFLVPEEKPVVWRGPMVSGLIRQFLYDVDWGQLDYLILDLPPGTGDAQLTLAQIVPMTGAIVTVTPQSVATHDAVKGMLMFKQLEVPILGVVENMSYFVCPCGCNHRTDIFGHGGGRRVAEQYELRFLGEVPIDTAIRDGGDTGRPIMVSAPTSTDAEAFRQIATQIASQVSIENARRASANLVQITGIGTR
ncbi:MAG TPA: Mrp/NBP35 family ATP-binding protein [Chloroflexota bacterium]|jgi:ATP-binding protein involved in chromosome partitioning|nr:Mrp/NBP35 family ATP-binding protein [Chloroflexota bacterium]